ncbi:MBL fold metallo-hydrolase [Candidatus Chloroploca sp. M-50]|uniref:MBL fold metallo-hydrolase n=1 Tax=Candidatus Chloroploca mongolica TaxID=2528176 RepID=A0ABS4D572_9CHLR|nr:MBL fold metallo-hydrolase [Candidatus Chloroploca mongolica]MBP1464590.1 MBL fold metallo-hydrolase [Candidatus Chloroploca mongolica]
MATMILLGTGTGLPDVDRGNTHMVWDGPGGPLLIDAGGSTYERLLRAGIDPQKLAGIVLTHSHCDHINGLPGLVFSMRLAGREDPLPIYGLDATLAIVQATMGAMQVEYHVPLEWQKLPPGSRLALDEGWHLLTAPARHSRPCLALRFEQSATGQALVYSADTEPSPEVQELASGATVLIHEATTAEPFEGHSSPKQAGAVAAEAGVKRLVLVHYSPRWTMAEEQALAAIRAGGFLGQAEIGRDGQRIEVS